MLLPRIAPLLVVAAALAGCVPTPDTALPADSTMNQPLYQSLANDPVIANPPPSPNTANFDARYTGRSTGALIDIPDDDAGLAVETIPNVPAPVVPKVNCTSATAENAGSLSCTN